MTYLKLHPFKDAQKWFWTWLESGEKWFEVQIRRKDDDKEVRSAPHNVPTLSEEQVLLGLVPSMMGLDVEVKKETLEYNCASKEGRQLIVKIFAVDPPKEEDHD